jgi:hypothetical protein
LLWWQLCWHHIQLFSHWDGSYKLFQTFFFGPGWPGNSVLPILVFHVIWDDRCTLLTQLLVEMGSHELFLRMA